jgi:hypothetical protein
MTSPTREDFDALLALVQEMRERIPNSDGGDEPHSMNGASGRTNGKPERREQKQAPDGRTCGDYVGVVYEDGVARRYKVSIGSFGASVPYDWPVADNHLDTYYVAHLFRDVLVAFNGIPEQYRSRVFRPLRNFMVNTNRLAKRPAISILPDDVPLYIRTADDVEDMDTD